jgi:hypothetical protein
VSPARRPYELELEREVHGGPIRGCLWVAGPSMILWAVAVLLVVRACSGG